MLIFIPEHKLERSIFKSKIQKKKKKKPLKESIYQKTNRERSGTSIRKHTLKL